MPTALHLIPTGGLTRYRNNHDELIIHAGPDAAGNLAIPALTSALNCYYDPFTGWPHKMLGATAVNSSAIGAVSVMGIFDYWRMGTTGAPARKVVAVAGTAIYKMDDSGTGPDGTWDSLLGSLESGKVPSFAVMNDELIIATTSNTDVPQVYDQTTIANLGGTPPNFAFCVEHKDRLWAAGAVAVPSRLYYTALGNHEDWTGTGSGSIDVYSDDGDQITGLASHNNELIIFKGPYRGSIRRLTGSAPTGSDAFALIPLVEGVGATNHNAIVAGAGDLVFIDHRGIHSLAATAKFGDYSPAYLSDSIRFIWGPDRVVGASADLSTLDHAKLDRAWGVYLSSRSTFLFAVKTVFTSSTNDLIVALDVRDNKVRAALWTAYSVPESLALVYDIQSSNHYGHVPWVGDASGRVQRGEQTNRFLTINAAGTAVSYTTEVGFPYLDLGNPWLDKGLSKMYINDLSNSGTTIFYNRDNATQQTDTLAAPDAVVDLSGSGKTFRVVLQHATNEDWRPYGLSLLVNFQGIGSKRALG